MANSDTPFGLKPVRHLNGNPWNGKAMRCFMTGATGNAFIGDPVTWAGSASADCTCPTVAPTTAGDGNKITGVIVGIETDATYTTIYRLTSTDRYVLVCVDPDVIYEVQADDTLAATDVGQNANLVTTHSGSTTTGISGYEMDATVGANASYQLLLLRASDRPDNDISSANAKWEVLINLHSFRAVDASAGGAAEGAKGV